MFCNLNIKQKSELWQHRLQIIHNKYSNLHSIIPIDPPTLITNEGLLLSNITLQILTKETGNNGGFEVSFMTLFGITFKIFSPILILETRNSLNISNQVEGRFDMSGAN